MSERRSLFGIDVDALTMDQTVERCLAAVREGRRLEIGVVNAAKLVNMRRDPRLARAVAGCDLVLADGQAVVWAARVLRAPLPERVAGIDLFLRLLAEAETAGIPVYFLGARPEVLQEMLRRVAVRFPALQVAGHRDGYFDDSEQEAVARNIAESGAQLLFLGMTSPKKEVFTAAWGARTGARVVHGVGGSFDILAGVTRRAPESWQRRGLEWLYRALQEPRRLGRRYLTTNAAFVLMTARERFRLSPSIAPANRSH
ncbi:MULTISPECIES: WecB/TagA/CpsF family glycosyltransferase [Streptomyces]|jgi:N-acetylglucosaminyldiphosphoundecaprenol N-acetyl-beta-D-mannosaminyltransferase|uniref:N-acetylglucosaminyldiphosphoundecaprenol N-acetyl-beta-D-mannosaminyltransferase n=2 Tax=Streptomyces TaxID=1883 RepID=A0ABT9L7H7_STRGD|nr:MULTISPECIES: WecB/TagA/CpsF family glycosyltransferase [Streptomyces]MDP9679653.1 N-acetylglucosaminyldiphosphoundecaprenol N-acetyl-beta-D-mannosaminyltransferase [Streptomyces griseoviridis]GGS99654.1 UDP-N-acetyl-D-mannosamine transferase [Streptomyces griseoviridis]GGU23719.1 UDP-N-acetyl-D-mannosamine transferase [Streptomyces daghestanicus]GHI29924.1 UDP-N-acetyl-D-mannosamine transferase [Streptomyces daghestanicus]